MAVRTRTLLLDRPIGLTFLLAAVLLALSLIAGEGVVKIDAVNRRLPPPSFGSELRQFELGVIELDAARVKWQHLDCILVGSSVLLNAVDAPTFERAYQSVTGKGIHCVKLYLPGLPTSFAGRFIKFLQERYNPGLIIYGASTRDFVLYTNSTDQLVDATPWFQYREGHFNFSGWLVDHFVSFRYLLLLRNWMKSPSADTPVNRIDPNLPLQAETEKALVERFAINRAVRPETLASIQQLGAINSSGTPVIIAEIPLHPTFSYYLPGGDADVQLARQAIQDRAHAVGLLFWPADDVPPIPKDGWFDRIHLQGQGQVIYSRWLGTRLGQAVQRGEIPDPNQPQGNR